MRVSIYILFSLFVLTSCQKFTWNNPYDIATPKSVFTPDGLAVRQEGENLLLSWNQDNSNISGFKLFRSIDRGVSTELVSLNKSTLSYTDGNIQGGKTYTYTLKAYADKNESNEVSTEILAKSRPTINTIAASAITENTATSGGVIVSDGGSPIISKGLVWSTLVNPTIDLTTKINDGSGSGAFERIITNLSPSTIYYVRAYATNSVGTAYGNQLTFTTGKPTAPPILESLTKGLVAFYPFNGNANDESGNGNNGTVNGAVLTTDRFENTNKAYSFSNNTVSVQNSSSLSFSNVRPFSVSIWVNSIANNQFVHYIGLREPGSQTKFWQIYSLANVGGVSGLAFQTNENFEMLGTLALNVSLPINTWVNIIGTYEFGNWKLYLNGTLITSTTSTKVFDNNINTILTIGNSGNFQPFYGKLDDIRIYNRALTQEEITYLANN
jgi:hypothetical protein